MLGIMITLLLSVVLVFNKTPITMAIGVACASVCISMLVYQKIQSMFTSAALVVSFSSGMMIVFCYCAFATHHEKKNSKMEKIALVFVVLLALAVKEETLPLNSTEKISMGLMNPFMMGAMAVVILSMVCINLSMFNPQKTLNSSY